jgi:hypothetical protein
MLHARLAEMRALRELPDPTKNKIFPVIKGRPWLNALSLDRVYEVISESYPERAYALDLDSTKLDIASDKPSAKEFAALFDAGDGYANYYGKVGDLDFAVPVLRYHPPAPLQLDRQLDHVQALDRGVIIRVLADAPGPVSDIAERCTARAVDNAVYLIDGGWGRDLLLKAAICVGLADSILDFDEDAEIVIGGSSFPDSFAKKGDRFLTSILERPLFGEVRRNINRGNLFYGDWGSTRPPTEPVPMRNVPRVDMPMSANWLSWRSDGDEDYEDLAIRAVQDSEWSGGLGIWGEYMIESTAEGLVPAIKSPAMAAAVRVNMHMHLQANLDTPDDLIVPDEPFDEGL